MTPKARAAARVRGPVLELKVWAWVAMVGVNMLSLSRRSVDISGRPDTVGFVPHHQGTSAWVGLGSVGVAWLEIAGFGLMVTAIMGPLLIARCSTYSPARWLPAGRGMSACWSPPS